MDFLDRAAEDLLVEDGSFNQYGAGQHNLGAGGVPFDRKSFARKCLKKIGIKVEPNDVAASNHAGGTWVYAAFRPQKKVSELEQEMAAPIRVWFDHGGRLKAIQVFTHIYYDPQAKAILDTLKRIL